MKFSIKDFFSKCDLVTFTEEIPNGKLHFLRSDYMWTVLQKDLIKHPLSWFVDKIYQNDKCFFLIS